VVFGLTDLTLRFAAACCGLEATDDEIKQQVAETKAWRDKQSARQGHPHYAPMRADKIGELLGITDMIRTEAKAWNIGTRGGSPEDRAKARRERDRTYCEARRRAAGSKTRLEFLEANNLSRLKPWEAEGISRTTWYRRQSEAEANETSPSATSNGTRNETGVSETGPSATSNGFETGPSVTTIHNELRSREFANLPSEAGDISAFGFPKSEPLARPNSDRERDQEGAELAEPVPLADGGIAARALEFVAYEHERRRKALMAVPASSQVLSSKVRLRPVAGPFLSPAETTPLQEECRASVERLLAEMAAENERRSQWWEQPVEGWNRGRLTIRSIDTAETTVIYLATKRGRA
jgi:hypothetical protein